jgi:nitroreductase
VKNLGFIAGYQMIKDLMQMRSSIRKFQKKPISDNDIYLIIEAGRYAPSGGNEQPRIFGIINDEN